MENNEKKAGSKKKSWLERNLWWVALFIALFILRMCSVLA